MNIALDSVSRSAWRISGVPCRLLCAAGLLLIVPGCPNTTSAPDVRARGERQEARPSDNLSLAMKFLHLSDDLDPEQARAQCAYHMNRWIETQEPDTSWSADPLFSRLKSRVRGPITMESLARRRFTLEDVRYLQQADWARSVASWVSLQPAPEYLREWLNLPPDGLSPDDAERLVAAERLFDWTIRNIQLDPLLAYPSEPAAGPGLGPNGGGQAGDGASPPALGIPGPGYTLYPWQVMLYGHGDAWQRARVFILLCRQLNIDAVMLGIDDDKLRPMPYPWLPAVLLGGQLYLFDTQLGMPIRGPDGQGIATLSQVRRDPALLEGLDVGTKYTYSVRGPQLEHVVALLDASPTALTQRMELIEKRLAGEDKLVVTAQPGRQFKLLSQVDGLQSVALWSLPFETEQYREALPGRVQGDPELARALFRGEFIYEGAHPVVMGRRQAFRGNFETREDVVGAKTLFLDARTPDYVIDNLQTDPVARERVGLEGNMPDNPVARQALLENTAILLRESKSAGSYWLGLAQFDTEQYEDAIEWLDALTLQDNADGRWAAGARYNLGRTYERLNQFDKARELYYADQSPQAHGNRLRARFFKLGEDES